MSNGFEINPDYVKSLTSFTDSFLCDLDDNIFNIYFTKLIFKQIQNNSNKTEKLLFELKNDSNNNINEEIKQKSKEIKDIYKNPRMVRYHLDPDILDLNMKLTLEYKNEGKKPLSLKMIENHYHDNKLIMQFFHDFGFCIPHSVNQQDITYKFNSHEIDKLSKSKSSFEIKTDTFFFANEKLIIHNKTLFYFSKKNNLLHK